MTNAESGPSFSSFERKKTKGNPFPEKGLNSAEVLQSRAIHGRNTLRFKKENNPLTILWKVMQEPMTILLLVASTIYFISGDTDNGIFMVAAILFISSISSYQDSRSKNALEKLKTLSQPRCKVIRDGEIAEISGEEVVVGDYLIVEEGNSITADGTIVYSNDFSVNESILTGESLPVYKDKDKEEPFIYAGTHAESGLALAKITSIGNSTRLGEIGKRLESIKEEKTPLEIKVNNFVKWMAIAGSIVFIIVWAINYGKSGVVLQSLLQSLTLAMSILPEEIPVAFTTFMALGAWRLMKVGIVVKQTKTVETLGSATVICTDKTGTITENKMSLAKLFTWPDKQFIAAANPESAAAKELIEWAMWASEPIPFDPMEIALHKAYADITQNDQRAQFQIIHEYPLGGKPPMMTHIFSNAEGQRIIAAKGAPEAIMEAAALSEIQKNEIHSAIADLASQGYRVLGVGMSHFSSSSFPEQQQHLPFEFKGLVAFYDPPKANIQQVLEEFYQAGIKVKIITGDNALTTASIARQIGFKENGPSISGDELMALSASALKECVKEHAIFTRMYPEAKLKIVDALKSNGEIVAMTGDGVNDGPALKAAHIGIAMGKKGSEIAKQAASLILLEDDLSHMVDAVAMGRRIYTNLKKAIQYIISIHIPIILAVFLPLAFGWVYPHIFSPIHVLFLELIMGPTCSIIYENEPMEPNTMLQKPKPFSKTFFQWNELVVSVIQGIIITIGILWVYHFSANHYHSEGITRTMVFVSLITSNIFLTLVNRSFYYSVFTTLKYKNAMVPFIIFSTIAMLALMLSIDSIGSFFQFESLDRIQLSLAILTGFISVIWFELIKGIHRAKNPLK
jgi:Ca2+-transporting ATPase